MANLIEFKVSKTAFDDVKNDLAFSCGFEAEFHVSNASDLLRDQEGFYPEDFETYSYSSRADQNSGASRAAIAQTYRNMHHETTTLVKLAALFESYLGLSHGAISIEDSGYTKWKLTVDDSLYEKPALLQNSDDDIGVELISP